MNSQDFQNICATLENKYAEGRLADKDVDAFADVISNVLNRDDLRDDGTAYASLSHLVSHNYENDINMNPLLARMYELCRMYENYRQRPLTEMERKEEQMEIGKKRKTKRPALLTALANGKPIISLWFEDLTDIDGIVDKVALLSEHAVGISAIYSEGKQQEVEKKLLEAFITAGGAFEQYDEFAISEAARILGADRSEIKIIGSGVSSMNESYGIIGFGVDGIARNKARGGVETKFSIDDESIRMDAYTIYGIDFIESLTGEKVNKSVLAELRDDDVEFSMHDAYRARDDWHNRLGDMFLLPGSDNLVGTKKPVPVANIGKIGRVDVRL